MPQNLQLRIQELELRIKQLEEANKALSDNIVHDSKSRNFVDKLRESEEKYVLTQTLAQVGSWEMDKEGIKIWASEEMLNLLGLNLVAGNIDLEQILHCVHNDDMQRVENAFNDLTDKNKNFNIEVKIIKPVKDDREIKYFEFVGFGLKNENDQIEKYIGVVKDITDLKKAIKELTRAKEKAEESDKLKTAFLANMSHDLRTPMNAIIGYSELLNLGNTNSQNRKEFSKIIKQKGLQLLTLIDDIIEVSRFETGIHSISKTEFDLNLLMKEVKDIYEDKKLEYGKESIQLVLNIPNEETPVNLFTDSGRLQQVLGNLISNGIKYTEKGFVEFGYTIEENDKVKFYVKDSGLGLTKDQQKYIFNRFKSIEKTTRLKYSGSGLGLTLSKRIVDLLEGKIWVDSEINKGAIFYFTIPLETPEEKEMSEAVNEGSDLTKLNWKDKVILIVEDEEINYKFLETVLQDTQAQILYARDGLQAIDLCLSINKIDMILMDIKMPEMDGFEAAKRIKQIRKEIPIIAQTAFASRDDKLSSLKSGCDDYISKPIEIELLISKINKFFIEKDF